MGFNPEALLALDKDIRLLTVVADETLEATEAGEDDLGVLISELDVLYPYDRDIIVCGEVGEYVEEQDAKQGIERERPDSRSGLGIVFMIFEDGTILAGTLLTGADQALRERQECTVGSDATQPCAPSFRWGFNINLFSCTALCCLLSGPSAIQSWQQVNSFPGCRRVECQRNAAALFG